MSLKVLGEVPDQQIIIEKEEFVNDVEISQGVVTSLLDGIGLTRPLLGGSASDFEKTLNEQMREYTADLRIGMLALPIPTPDYIYLPKVTENRHPVVWSNPPESNGNVAPYGIQIERIAKLPKTLACSVIKCLKRSEIEGKLLVKSCSLE